MVDDLTGDVLDTSNAPEMLETPEDPPPPSPKHVSYCLRTIHPRLFGFAVFDTA
jgi:hypothetical protein